MTVMIGIDPHKASHTAVAIDNTECVLDELRVRACSKQTDQLRAWAAPFPDQVWAIETSEELIPEREFGWIMRSLGERGVLAAVDAIIVARPPGEEVHTKRTSAERQAHRARQRDTALEMAHRYNPDAVVCVGPPFGHTRPQWIVPYGGTMTIDSTSRKVWAQYS
jgi:muramoyltetrapeptide carboxypeptidase LdcA involved in peptidoglycan recycling